MDGDRRLPLRSLGAKPTPQTPLLRQALCPGLCQERVRLCNLMFRVSPASSHQEHVFAQRSRGAIGTSERSSGGIDPAARGHGAQCLCQEAPGGGPCPRGCGLWARAPRGWARLLPGTCLSAGAWLWARGCCPHSAPCLPPTDAARCRHLPAAAPVPSPGRGCQGGSTCHLRTKQPDFLALALWTWSLGCGAVCAEGQAEGDGSRAGGELSLDSLGGSVRREPQG